MAITRPSLEQLKRTSGFVNSNGNVRSTPRDFVRMKDRTESDPNRRIKRQKFSEVEYNFLPDGRVLQKRFGLRIEFENNLRRRTVPDVKEEIIFNTDGTFTRRIYEFIRSKSGKRETRKLKKVEQGTVGGERFVTRLKTNLTASQKRNRRSIQARSQSVRREKKPSVAQLRRIATDRFRKLGQGPIKRVETARDGTVVFKSAMGGKYTFPKGFRSKEILTNAFGKGFDVTGKTAKEIAKIKGLQTPVREIKKLSKSQVNKILENAARTGSIVRKRELKRFGLQIIPTDKQLRQMRTLQKQGFKVTTDAGGRVVAKKGKRKIVISSTDKFSDSARKKKIENVFIGSVKGFFDFPVTFLKGMRQTLQAVNLSKADNLKYAKYLKKLSNTIKKATVIKKKQKINSSDQTTLKKLQADYKKANANMKNATRNIAKAGKILNTAEVKFFQITTGLIGAGAITGGVGGFVGFLGNVGLGTVGVIATGDQAIATLKNPTPRNFGRLAFFVIPTALAVAKGTFKLSRNWKPTRTNLKSLLRNLERQKVINKRALIKIKAKGLKKDVSILLKQKKQINQAIGEVKYALKHPQLSKSAKQNIKAYQKEFRAFKKSVKSGVHKKSTKVVVKINPKLSAKISRVSARFEKSVGKPIRRTKIKAKDAVRKRVARVKKAGKKKTLPVKNKINQLSKKSQATLKKIKKRFQEAGFNIRFEKLKKREGIRELKAKISGLVKLKVISKKTFTDIGILLNKSNLKVIRIKKSPSKASLVINRRVAKQSTKTIKFKVKVKKGKKAAFLIRSDYSKLLSKIGSLKRSIRSFPKRASKLISNFKKFVRKEVSKGAWSIKVEYKPSKSAQRKITIKTKIPTRKAVKGYIRSQMKPLRVGGVNVKMKFNDARFNARMKRLGQRKAVMKFIRARFSRVKSALSKSKGVVNKSVMEAVKRFNKVSPINIQVVNINPKTLLPAKAFKKIIPKARRGKFIFKDIRTGKTRVFNDRRTWFKAIKQQAKFLDTVQGKRILRKKGKARTRPSRVALEKQRKFLRKQQKIEKKIKKGLQIKADRPPREMRGGKKVYPFTDKSTGKIRYFTSRKLWLKAVKKQVGKQKPVKLSRLRKRRIASRRKQPKKDLKRLRRRIGPQKAKPETLRFLDRKVRVVRTADGGAKIVDQNGNIIIKVRKLTKTPVQVRDTVKKANKVGREVSANGTVLIVKAKGKTKSAKLKNVAKQKKIITKIKVLKAKRVLAKSLGEKGLVAKLGKQIMVASLFLRRVRGDQKIASRSKSKSAVKVRQKSKVLSKSAILSRQKRASAQSIRSAVRSKSVTKSASMSKQAQARKKSLVREKVKKQKAKVKKLVIEREKKVSKIIKLASVKRKFIYLPDLVAILDGAVAKKSEKRKLLQKGRVFTGLEARKLVR